MNTSPAPTSAPPASAEPIIIERKNVLRERVGGSLDDGLAHRAEASVNNLSGNFTQWLEETVTHLLDARQAMGASPINRQTGSALYTAVLETKSLGETYGYPLVSRFSHSLARLLVKLPEDKNAPCQLVDAHIDAIRAVLRTGMTKPNDPVGIALAIELEQQVAALLV